MRAYLSDFFRAIKLWFLSWSFIQKHKLAHFFLYPILFSILFSMGALAGIKFLTEWLMNFIQPQITHVDSTEGILETITEFIKSYTASGISLITVLFSWYLFQRIKKYVVLAAMSPLMAVLSERTDSIITGNKFPFSWTQLLTDIIRGIFIAIRNMILELTLTVVIWMGGLYLAMAFPLLSFLIAPISALLSFLIGSYYFGFSILDYTNERRKLSARNSFSDIRKNKGFAIGIGSVFSVLFILPFVGVALATVTCTIAGTTGKVSNT